MASAGALHPLQRAFIDCGAAQCGYCTPGILLGAVHLLESIQAPTETEIRMALAGHLCRCTGYTKIVEAITLASQRMHGPKHA
ncbi:MAG: (2Fe-2S)-binding protein, partial [Vulcanimicrobiaceae bacterium]